MTEKQFFKKRDTEDLIRIIKPLEKEQLKDNPLYIYQKEVIKNSQKNWLYRLDTGTGKTLIAIYHFLKYTLNTKKLLIVCPASKYKELGWNYEIRKIELKYGIKIDYSVITFGKLRNMPIDYETIQDTFVIIDESHNVKNTSSLQGKSAVSLLRVCYGFALLSATPTPQGYIDMLNYFLMFGKIDNWYRFKEEHGIFFKIKNKYTGKDTRILKDWKPNSKNYMNDMFSSFSSVPLKKEDCIDLPSQTFVTVPFTKSREYKILEKAAEDILTFEKLNKSDIDETVKNKLMSKMKLLKLEDINSIKDFKIRLDKKFTDIENFDIDHINSIAKLQYALRLFTNMKDKLEWIDEFIQNTENNIIIFYNFNIEKEQILKMLSKNAKHDILSVYTSDRIPSEDIIKKDHRQKIMLIQLAQGGASLNLQYCNEVIYFTPDYNYGNYTQSLGRAYRNGQTRKVTVYNLNTEDTIDERIYDVLKYKESVNDEIEKYKTLSFNTASDYLFRNDG